MRKTEERSCGGCGETFLPSVHDQRCRSRSCRDKTQDYREVIPLLPNLPAGTVGALRELLVAADLMERGYHVFRAISPACPCDLVVQNDEVTFRVEVRSLRRNRIGYLYHGVTRSDIGSFDVLASVATDKTIRYATYDEAASREQGRIVLAPYEP